MKAMILKIDPENKYLHLLLVLVLFFLFSPFLEKLEIEFPLISLVFLTVIIFTLRALDVSKRIFLTSIFIGGLAFLCELAFSFGLSGVFKDAFELLSLIIYSLFLILSIVLMLQKMFSVTKVTGDTIRGGICVYLLIGFLWTIFYYIIYFFDKNAFYFSSQMGDIYLFYFSFTTITTVGYGDIYPINKAAMALANIEAIFGQMYLVIFIARMVGLHIVHHVSEK